MTNEEKKTYLLTLMRNTRGDNLERATAAFRHYTEKQLDEPYGQSDNTPRQILEQYRINREEHDTVTKWIEDL
jgi:hypothetical protein